MVTVFTRTTSHESPEKIKAELEAALDGGKDFSKLIKNNERPTEIEPISVSEMPEKSRGVVDNSIIEEMRDGVRSLNIGEKGTIPQSGETPDILEYRSRSLYPEKKQSKIEANWKQTKGKVLSVLKAIPSMKVVAGFLKGASFEEAVNDLAEAYKKGLLSLADARLLENEMEIPGMISGETNNKISEEVEAENSAIGKEGITSESEPEAREEKKDPFEKKVKVSRVIHIPKAEMKAKVKVDIKDPVYSKDAEAIVSQKSNLEIEKSDLLEKSREPLPEKVDNFFDNNEKISEVDFGQKANEAYEEGNIGDALVYINRITDIAEQAEVVGQIVEECVKKKDFTNAHKFVEKIKLLSYKKDLSGWVYGIEMGETVKTKKKKESEPEIPNSTETVEEQSENETKEVTEAEIVDNPQNKKSTKSKNSEDLPIIDLMKDKDYFVEKEKDINVKVENKEEKSKKVEGEARVENTTNLEAELESAREEYAKHYIEYKNKLRSKKGWFGKHLADLGFDKQLPESDKPQEFKDAEAKYIEAKKKRSEALFKETETRKVEVSGQILNLREISFEFNPKLLEESQKEFDILQGKIQESLPKLEKGIAGKALEKWAKMGRVPRIALSTFLVTGTNVAFGALTLPAAVGYGGYRFGRSLAGAATSQGAGKAVESYFDKKNSKNRKESGEDFSFELNEENFAEREKQMIANLENEKDLKKRQRLIKAGVMVAAGGASTYAIGQFENMITSPSSLSTPTVGSPAEKLPVSESIKPIGVPEAVKPVDVEVSSKGFIDTMHHVKEEIVKSYGGADKVPTEIHKNILDKSDVDLAKELHMYDPEHNLSAVLSKGESVKLDESGNLVYHHIDGKTDLLIDTKTGLVEKAELPMKNYAEAVDTHTPAKFGEGIKSNEPVMPVEENIHPPIHITEEPIIPASDVETESVVDSVPHSVSRVLYNNNTVDVMNLDNGVGRAIMYQGREIAHEHVLSGGQKAFYLDDEYQENPMFVEIRGAFNAMYEKNISNTQVIKPIDFEGGKIYVLEDTTQPNSLKVLLNGKEIAKGLVGADGTKVKINSDLKGGWFLADNAYERAFKASQKLVKNIRLKQ